MNGTTHNTRQIEACPDCDLLMYTMKILPGERLRCPRCGALLHASISHSLSKTLALSLTGIILFFPAMFEPIMTISVAGMEGESSVISSILGILQSEYFFVGIMLFAVSFLFPLIKLLLLLGITLPFSFGCKPQATPRILRWYKHLDEWGMTEIYMLGILISIIKMHSLGHLNFNLGFFCFSALSLIIVALSTVIDEEAFWEMYQEKAYPELTALPQEETTAEEMGLMRCLDCGQLMQAVAEQEDTEARCPRCHAPVYPRRPNNTGATLALLLCAAILYLPANLLPIMRVDFLGVPEITTIMDGIVYFFQSGEYLVGAIILTASILVPLFKLVGMSIILLSVHFGWKSFLNHTTKMYRFIEFIGRWSFLDIFVIALMVAMVKFGALTSILAYPGAKYFTAVVMLTMLAAIVFDPRMLWDKARSCSRKPKRDL